MQLDKFLLDVFEKAGIEPTDQRVTELLAHTELNRIEIPNEVGTRVRQSLISLDAAKDNHPAVKPHYYGQVMNLVDKALEDVYQIANFSDDDIKELNKEKSSTRRIAAAVNLFKTKTETPGDDKKGGSKGDSEALKQRVNELTAELAQVKTNWEKDKQEHQNNFTGFKKETKLASKLSGFKTTFDGLPQDVKLSTLKGLLSKELQDNNAELILDENEDVVLIRKDGTKYVDENQKSVGVDDFISKTFAKNKVLQNSAPAATGDTGETYRANGAETNGQTKSTKYAGLYDNALQSVSQAPVQMV